MRDLRLIFKYKVFSFFLSRGINIYAKKYKIIPQATSFFRNRVLLKTIFEYCKENKYENLSAFFHAGSTGEEAYSFIIYNNEKYGFNIKVNIGEYESNAVKKIEKAIYTKKCIENENSKNITDEFKKYFVQKGNSYRVRNDILDFVDNVMECDYTKINNEFISKYSSDIVFCNNTLLYHEEKIQEEVLKKLCQQAKKMLIISGAGYEPLETVLVKNGFVPYKKNWEDIYDGWRLRRCKIDKIYPTPTTPYLSDRDKSIEHFFRYSIFIKK